MAMQFPPIADNPHLRAIERQFGTISVAPETLPEPVQFVFICFTNRCGSNHLADAMQSDGRLNMAGELFNADAVLEDTRLHGHASFAEYLRLQVSWRMRGGRFVVKTAIPHLDLLGRAGVLDAVQAAAHFVFLTREDRLAQAISYDIAEQSGQWVAGTPSRGAPTYSRERLERIMRGIAEQNGLFEEFFALNAIAPVRLTYEAFVADRPRGLAAIGAAIGLPDLRLVPAALRHARQSGPLNAAWRARYRAGD